MPIKLSKKISAYEILKQKGIFVMTDERAESQEIRPLRIGILNLMPTKKVTEAQLLRMIGGGPLQIESIMIRLESYISKNTSAGYLEEFYQTFSQVKKIGLDGLIITGAPIEEIPFEEVKYWKELTEIFDWAKNHVTSNLCICWGAQAALYHLYGTEKYMLPEKISGIFPHSHGHAPELLRGVDDFFNIPHSRNTYNKKSDIENNPELEILAESKKAGVSIAATKTKNFIFNFGHLEYDRDTLQKEYDRDKNAGLNPKLPENYFPNNDDSQTPILSWRANADTFFRNWINFVYQETGYDVQDVHM